MSKYTNVLVLSAVIFTVGLVSAVTDEEKSDIRAAVLPVLEACGKELDIAKEDVLAAKDAKNPDALNPCFFACVFKKLGTLNDQGLFEPSVAKDLHKKYIKGQDDLTQLDSITDTCTSVNDQTVSDGAQGCERSKLLVKCFLESTAPFTPFSK